MRHLSAFSLASVALALSATAFAEGSGPPGPPSPPQQPYLPGGVSFSGYAFAYLNQNVVEGGLNGSTVFTYGGGAGTPYNFDVASWGNADSLARIQVQLTTDASAYSSATQVTRGRSAASAGLTYRVLLVADDATAASDIATKLANGDVLATVNGSWNVTANGYGYGTVSARTGYNVPGLDGSPQPAASQTCGAYGQFADASTPGCGAGSFSLGLNFVATDTMIGGDALSFVSTISLFSSANAGIAGATFTPYPGTASAFIDPSVTLAPGLHATLVLGNNGDVANAVPEPATWALMLAGVAGLLAWRRQQS